MATASVSESMAAFREAKDHLLPISAQFLEKCVQDFINSLINADENKKLIGEETFHSLSEDLQITERAIREIQKSLSRENMKVVFVGRTSSGKSNLINAILQKGVLPSDAGHTTNCFIHLSGTDEKEAKLSYNGNPVQIEDIGKIGDAVVSGDYGINVMLFLEYPRQECAILKHDLVLLDTPGLDNDEDLDTWLFDKCSDADVIVLVVDGSSSMSRTEKGFIEALATRFSTMMDLFVVFNKWDLVMGGGNNDQQKIAGIRKQHEESVAKLVAKVFGISNATSDSSKLSFFLSSLKILNGESVGIFSNEFTHFQTVLMKTASVSAMQKKINRQLQNLEGKNNNILNLLKRILQEVKTDKEIISSLANGWKSLTYDIDLIVSAMNSEVCEQIQGQFGHCVDSWNSKLSGHMNSFTWDKKGKNKECGEALFAYFRDFFDANKKAITGDFKERLMKALKDIRIQVQQRLQDSARSKCLCFCASVDLSKLKSCPGPCAQNGGSCPSFLTTLQAIRVLSCNPEESFTGAIDEIMNSFVRELQQSWTNKISSFSDVDEGIEIAKIVLGTLSSLTIIGAASGASMIMDGAAKLNQPNKAQEQINAFALESYNTWSSSVKKASINIAKDVNETLRLCLKGFVEQELMPVWVKHEKEFDRLERLCLTIQNNCDEVKKSLEEFRMKHLR